MYKPSKYQLKFLRWRRKQRDSRVMPLILSALVGVIVGLAAILIKTIISYVEEYAIRFFPGFLYLIIPMVGLLLVVFLNRNIFYKTVNFRGARHVIEAIKNNGSVINFRLMYSKFITTGLSIGFGGSSGVEAAIITTGSAIGSNTGQFLGLGYKQRTLMIGCGIAGGISAIYNAPVGGFLFALETVLPEFTPTLLIPLLISAVFGKILFEVFMGDQLRFEAPIPDFTYDQLPFVLALGIAGMLAARFLDKTYRFCYRYLSMIKNDYLRAITGGLILGTVIFLFPPMYGEGYVSVNELLRANESEVFSNSVFSNFPHTHVSDLLFFLLLTIAKPLSTGLSVNSGGEGGYFAPSIITGGFLGYFFYKAIFLFAPGADLVVSPVTYIYLGMAATFACVMNAPVTAIFLIADITQSYELFVPLMLVCATSYFLKYSSENKGPKAGAKKSDRRLMHTERMVLNQVSAHELLEKDVVSVRPGDTLRKLAELSAATSRDVIPVTNGEGRFEGIVKLNDIRKKLYDTEHYDSVRVSELCQQPEEIISLHEPASSTLERFDRVNSWYLPVVHEEKFMGFISRMKVLARYRSELNKGNRFF
ncbi:CIC family chloride channel protein [Anseongella ginsenosidimutans]|uniref:CIC family chloride channel protein n=1 Tax=Anseongella ginsenosidimutans TaxID=496056 RepID=A0A4V6NZ17_9SPHI|nr:chloride channel protein [Anseongella ginsenosidimutans]QEC52527.1 chloride channel protein [Anseongella ginsenosidimutans]TCS85289.1 CIC family chloride channel protein [Anseongella ginsenosidimutans]